MEYVNINGYITKRQGESITKWYNKTSGDIFEANEGAYWTLTDPDGTIVLQGTLSKSGDSLEQGFTVSKNDTTDLLGSYLLLARATDTNNTDMDDVFASYDVTFNNLAARS